MRIKVYLFSESTRNNNNNGNDDGNGDDNKRIVCRKIKYTIYDAFYFLSRCVSILDVWHLGLWFYYCAMCGTLFLPKNSHRSATTFLLCSKGRHWDHWIFLCLSVSLLRYTLAPKIHNLQFYAEWRSEEEAIVPHLVQHRRRCCCCCCRRLCRHNYHFRWMPSHTMYTGIASFIESRALAHAPQLNDQHHILIPFKDCRMNVCTQNEKKKKKKSNKMCARFVFYFSHTHTSSLLLINRTYGIQFSFDKCSSHTLHALVQTSSDEPIPNAYVQISLQPIAINTPKAVDLFVLAFFFFFVRGKHVS